MTHFRHNFATIAYYHGKSMAEIVLSVIRVWGPVRSSRGKSGPHFVCLFVCYSGG